MESLVTGLGQYGILGIFSGLMIICLVYIFKMLIAQVEKRLEQTQKDLDTERDARLKLQERFDVYVADDRKQLGNTLSEATQVMKKVENVLDRVEKKL